MLMTHASTCDYRTSALPLGPFGLGGTTPPQRHADSSFGGSPTPAPKPAPFGDPFLGGGQGFPSG